jgi:hypothetical protein
VVHICEPETGKSLSDDEDKRSMDDLKDFQEGRSGLSSCQVGNGKRSMVDLKDCQVGSNESSDCQVGNEMGSLEDLIDFYKGRKEIPYFQVGKGEETNSAESSYQQGELMEEVRNVF